MLYYLLLSSTKLFFQHPLKSIFTMTNPSWIAATSCIATEFHLSFLAWSFYISAMLSMLIVMLFLLTLLFMSTNSWRCSVQGTPCLLPLIVAIEAIMEVVEKSSFRDFKEVLTLAEFSCSFKHFVDLRIQTVITSILYILCLARSISISVGWIK